MEERLGHLARVALFRAGCRDVGPFGWDMPWTVEPSALQVPSLSNAQGEHSTGATAEGDMLDPVVVPDFAHGNAPEKKLKKLPQGVDTTRGLW